MASIDTPSRYVYVDKQSLDADVTVLSAPGSHYVMKVMAVLNYRHIPYKLEILDFRKLKELLPAPHTVPVMLWNGERIPDSTAICKFVDHKFPHPGANLFEPPGPGCRFQTVEEAEKWLGGEYYEWNLYWSFIDPEGFERGLGAFVRTVIPLPGCLQACFGCCLAPDVVLGDKIQSMKERLHRALGSKVASREAAVRGTIECLQQIDACFATDEQRYLLNTEYPTAADFTLYGITIRLVDRAFDVNLEACLPGAFEMAKTLRFRAWYLRMRDQFPLQWYRK